MRFPLVIRCSSRLNAVVTSVIHFSFSEPYVKTSSSLSAEGAANSASDEDLDLHAGKEKMQARTINADKIRKPQYSRKRPENIRVQFIGPHCGTGYCRAWLAIVSTKKIARRRILRRDSVTFS